MRLWLALVVVVVASCATTRNEQWEPARPYLTYEQMWMWPNCDSLKAEIKRLEHIIDDYETGFTP